MTPTTRLAAVLVFAALALPAAGASSSAQAGYDTAPRESPDGQWLLFERLYGGGRYTAPDTSLRIARADGTAERELVSRTRALNALWTPDSLIEVRVPNTETVLLRPENGTIVGRMPVAASAWSPDGMWVAYVDGSRDLYVSRPDGSSARRLAEAPELGAIGVGAFSPDSSRLTYVVYAVGTNSSEVVGVNGANRVVLKEAPVAAPGIWSPDGRSLVLMAQNDRPHYRPPRVYVINADGSGAHVVSPGFGSSPDWSRGDWIVYLRQTSTLRRDVYDLMLVRPDGSERRRVVRTNGSGATWLIDGRHLFAVGDGPCRRTGILEIDAFDRTVKRLTNRCRIQGTPAGDHLRGTPLRDLLYGLGGDDRISGGSGDDELNGGSGNDVLAAGAGNDVIYAADGPSSSDRISCGPGRDRVVADRRDHVSRDCERVIRR